MSRSRRSDSDNNRPFHWMRHNQYRSGITKTEFGEFYDGSAPAFIPPQEMSKGQFGQLERERATLEKQLSAAANVVRNANSDGTHLRDNASFRAAEDERGRIEARLLEINSVLRHAVIVEESRGQTSFVRIGSKIHLILDGDNVSYTIVLPHDSALRMGRISCESPIGKALLGHRVGDVFDIPTPEAVSRAKITKIE